jgi:hypothetical protein
MNCGTFEGVAIVDFFVADCEFAPSFHSVIVRLPSGYRSVDKTWESRREKRNGFTVPFQVSGHHKIKENFQEADFIPNL